MKIFGFTIIRWPQAERHETAFADLEQEIDAQREANRLAIATQRATLKQTAEAITMSIKVQQDDLTRLNALRGSLDVLDGSIG